jgi:hypothetical protein
MVRGVVRLAAVAQLFILLGYGCDTIGLDRGPKYDVDWSKFGTGEQAITPTNDSRYVNGMPLDARTK